jgi:hypothetical protein
MEGGRQAHARHEEICEKNPNRFKPQPCEYHCPDLSHRLKMFQNSSALQQHQHSKAHLDSKYHHEDFILSYGKTPLLPSSEKMLFKAVSKNANLSQSPIAWGLIDGSTNENHPVIRIFAKALHQFVPFLHPFLFEKSVSSTLSQFSSIALAMRLARVPQLKKKDHIWYPTIFRFLGDFGSGRGVEGGPFDSSNK